jgi:transcriptional regulator with XRE-family HTH domain
MLSFEKIGEKIRLIRDSKNLNQTELAEMVSELGVKMSRETLSKIETGNRSISMIEIKAIATSLDVSTDDFFDDEDGEEESLVKLFRKKSKEPLNETKESYLDELQTVIKGLVTQEKIYNGEFAKRRTQPRWKGDGAQ